MKDLFRGIKNFKEKEYRRKKEIFQRLRDNQKPHTLFIGCSDSRVLPALITKSLPGELFVIRNIANIVPPWREEDEYLATTSAIEYAVLVLNVENIVVCGHSDCGGCKALLGKEESADIPHVSQWMKLAGEIKEKFADAQEGKKTKQLQGDVEKENVIRQMEHLMTYPFVLQRYENGQVKVYGWYYDIPSGTVYNYNRQKEKFISIK